MRFSGPLADFVDANPESVVEVELPNVIFMKGRVVPVECAVIAHENAVLDTGRAGPELGRA